jgi:fluoride exporter
MLIFGLLVAGAVGAPVRFLLDGFIQENTSGGFPWGTLVINISGSFVLGLLSGFALYHAFPATPKTVLGSGFCGAYTTFSTFTYETVRLAEGGQLRGACRYTLTSLIVPALAAGLGLALASL